MSKRASGLAVLATAAVFAAVVTGDPGDGVPGDDRTASELDTEADQSESDTAEASKDNRSATAWTPRGLRPFGVAAGWL